MWSQTNLGDLVLIVLCVVGGGVVHQDVIGVADCMCFLFVG